METYFPHLASDAVTSPKAKQKHKLFILAASLMAVCLLAYLSL